jgi:dedicator of cytokinesis protein 3
MNFLESTLDIEGKDNLSRQLNLFLGVATSILENDAWPKTWLNVNILAHKVILKMAQPMATVLIRDFIPEQQHSSQFDATLWQNTFYVLLKLLSSEQLVIEEFSPQVGLITLYLWNLLMTSNQFS